MNQQQLQTARAALWHQTAAQDPASRWLTSDDAARWLDDLGVCLFVPRHGQLPAPAPSFVEAFLGAPAITPSPAAIAEAFAMTTRLIEEGRAIPLNLLASFTEQPDFLITPEVLPWVAAVRGDRQWKSPPGGRAAPIVIRVWETLNREGECTAVAIREQLGRELTEAAVLRALIELWTSVRAMPVYAAGGPTRWTLLRNRYPAQLATAASTAQTTALSALLSIYLRSAVAATPEEAEIFLSPLTARSRIREVLHGMTATRQLGATTVASQTVLFVEGSLPEAETEAEPDSIALRKEPRPTRWELPAGEAASTEESSGDPWKKKPAAAALPRKGPADRGAGQGKRFASRPGNGARRKPPGDRPWPRRADGSRPFRGNDRRAFQAGQEPGRERSRDGRPGPRQDGSQERSRERRPENGRPFRKHWGKRDEVRPSGRPPREPGSGTRRESRPEKKSGFGSRPWTERRSERRSDRRPRPASEGRPEPGPETRSETRNNRGRFAPGRRRDSSGAGPGNRKFGGKDRFSPAAKSRFGKAPSGGSSRPFRPAKSSGGPGPSGRGKPNPGKFANKFGKSSPRERNPRKNRSQEKNPE